jgi:hypothetical protein
VYLPKLKRFLAAYRDRYHPPGSPIIMDQVMGFGEYPRYGRQQIVDSTSAKWL